MNPWLILAAALEWLVPRPSARVDTGINAVCADRIAAAFAELLCTDNGLATDACGPDAVEALRQLLALHAPTEIPPAAPTVKVSPAESIEMLLGEALSILLRAQLLAEEECPRLLPAVDQAVSAIESAHGAAGYTARGLAAVEARAA